MLQLNLRIDAHFEIFKQSANKLRYIIVKKLHCAAPIHLLKRCMACLNIFEIASGSLVRLATGVISKPPVFEHVHKSKIARHA